MSGKSLLRRGCLVALLLLMGLGALLAFGWWRARSAPEAFKEQVALLETRTESERRQLAEQTETRLRQAAGSGPYRRQGRAGSFEAPDLSGGTGSPGTTPSKEGSVEGSDRRRSGEETSPRRAEPSTDGGPRQVTLRLDELNALLQERVARWEARRRGSPLPIRNPILAIEGDHLVLYIQLLNRGSEMLLGLPVDVAIDDRGGVARLLGVRLGQLPLPGLEALPRLLRSTGDPGLAKLAEDAEAAANGYPFDPILEIDNASPLRILGLEVDAGEQALHLTVG